MENNKIDPVLEEVCADIADFTVGFAIVRTSGGAEDADPAGSGTLVAVGSVHGILTAAHVLKNLPDQGEVGLVRFPRVQSVVAQRTMIDMAQAEKVIVAADNFGPEGPDIGFLRLSPWDASALTARNVFFNLGMRRKAVLAGDQPDSQCFDGVSGMVAEWTTDLLPEEQPPVRVKAFRALFGVGLVVGVRESNGFDLFDFEVTYGPGSVSPHSYEGVSGGALWRVYVTKDDDGQLSVVDKKVFGVAFHQSDLSEQKRIITCHGPRSVYGPLIDSIWEEWPE